MMYHKNQWTINDEHRLLYSEVIPSDMIMRETLAYSPKQRNSWTIELVMHGLNNGWRRRNTRWLSSLVRWRWGGQIIEKPFFDPFRLARFIHWIYIGWLIKSFNLNDDLWMTYWLTDVLCMAYEWPIDDL